MSNSTAADIATYLQTNISGLTLGLNLFVGSEPTSPANVITIYDTGGYPPDQTLDGDLIYRHSIQIRLRNTSYPTGFAQMALIRDTITPLVRSVINNADYLGAFLTADIIHLGQVSTNAGLCHVWTLNAEIIQEGY